MATIFVIITVFFLAGCYLGWCAGAWLIAKVFADLLTDHRLLINDSGRIVPDYDFNCDPLAQ